MTTAYKVFAGLLTLAAFMALGVFAMGEGWLVPARGPGEITQASVPEMVADKNARQAVAITTMAAPTDKQILFGDLHVHTSFSTDAFFMSLPLMNGEGAHPPADACDFARFCSALDFWSINDHVEGFTPAQWTETKETIRQCNASAGDPANPDLVSFLGWEWTQIGSNIDNHYGHKNVVFLDTADDLVPARPIGSEPVAGTPGAAVLGAPLIAKAGLAISAPDGGRREYMDFAKFLSDRSNMARCAEGVDVRDLPLDCLELTEDPAALFEKLRQWAFPTLVIPHGNAWGNYTPPGSTWDKQLSADQHDESLQKLVEIYSGHGSSEEYRDWRGVLFDSDNKPYCPQPSDNYESTCWRAGEIIRDRCIDAGESLPVCDARATTARAYAAKVGAIGFAVVPGAEPEDWGDAGQCRDCFLGAFNFRPGTSAQYALAHTNFDDPENLKRFRFGFIGSSDNHFARAGTGYKEFWRQRMVEGGGSANPGDFMDPAKNRRAKLPYAEEIDIATTELSGADLSEAERLSSYFLTGGLVAVHAQNRDRHAIWDGLSRREVYATSGDRILLWFDLDNPNVDDALKAPMGSEVVMPRTPKFTVRALGAFEQKPGCPDYVEERLSHERLQRLCRGECYNPSDVRKKITHIEVVRVLPQIEKGEPIAPLVQDPWRTIACDDTGRGCVAEFEDPEYVSLARDATYYVRAIQTPSPAINGDSLSCEFDDQGKCVKVKLCYRDYRTDPDDDCLSDVAERAWSSPIYLTRSID